MAVGSGKGPMGNDHPRFVDPSSARARPLCSRTTFPTTGAELRLQQEQGCSRSIDLCQKDQDLLIELDLLGELDHN